MLSHPIYKEQQKMRKTKSKMDMIQSNNKEKRFNTHCLRLYTSICFDVQKGEKSHKYQLDGSKELKRADKRKQKMKVLGITHK